MATRAAHSLTIDDLDAYDPDEDRFELIDGELVWEEATGFAHGDAQVSLSREISIHFRGSGPPGGEGWWLASEVDVVYARNQLFRHDVAGWRKSRVPERPQGRVTVRPDWACEILSKNRAKDLHQKRRVMHQAGVPFYWLLDPDAPLLTILGHREDGYTILSTHAPGERARLPPFDAVELEIAALFGDLG